MKRLPKSKDRKELSLKSVPDVSKSSPTTNFLHFKNKQTGWGGVGVEAKHNAAKCQAVL